LRFGFLAIVESLPGSTLFGGIHHEIHRATNGRPSIEGVACPAMVDLATQKTDAGITDRQREIVALIAAGCSNDEVGARLGISPRTAKAHSDVLRQKLGVKRRRQIPMAFRILTGEDPLSAGFVTLGPLPSR
jgi:DNA-binding CsgD family transcriptional regulator